MADLDLGEIARSAARSLEAIAIRPPAWKPLPHQIPPPGEWYGWLLNAGRGSGKTDAVANYVVEHVRGKPCLPGGTPHWIGIIAPTLGDAVTACYAGPSGIKAHDPSARLVQSAGGTVIRWPNGSEAKLFGAQAPEDVERLRAGGNRCLSWLEELAAWRYLQACWEQMRFGLRVGPRPHWVASTTPKPRPLIKKLVKNTPNNVVVTTASTYDNPHLPDEIQQALNEEYGSTQLGRQELNAELLEEDRDALWKRDTLERYRIMPDIFDIAVESQLIHLSKVTVGVDPSGGAGEQGIVVVGRGTLLTPDIEGGAFLKPGERAPMHGFVIADKTCCLSPHGWGRKAVQAALDTDASDIVVERNYGGDMAVATIQDACDSLNVTLPVRTVNASRGKRVRAEPVSALSERGRWHLVGSFPELEDQLCVAEGTLIVTSRGDVPIECMTIDDVVWTRAGWRSVVWAGQTGLVTTLTELSVGDQVLKCTPSHPIWVDDVNDFISASEVWPGATIQTCRVKSLASSSSTEAFVTLPKDGIGARRATDPVEVNCCTLWSTKMLTDRHLRDITFTTSITTGAITRLTTLLRSAPVITFVRTLLVGVTRKRSVSKGVNGVEVSGSAVNLVDSCAAVVMNHSSHSVRMPTTARAVVRDVVTVTDRPTRVFNLMVRDQPEFYANGVLTHNCTWTPESDYSPDRLDAMVWPAWHLKLATTRSRGVGQLPLSEFANTKIAQ